MLRGGASDGQRAGPVSLSRVRHQKLSPCDLLGRPRRHPETGSYQSHMSIPTCSVTKVGATPPTEPNRPKAAIFYDFDGTLARGNIQERSFIPSVGLTHEEFWKEAKKDAKDGDADEILCYMQLLVKAANEKKVPVTADQLREHGKDADLFPGLIDGSWFDRMNAFAAESGLDLEHYIVSSGTFEMIVGCPIYPRFKRVFGKRGKTVGAPVDQAGRNRPLT
jgi:hypothetical protein